MKPAELLALLQEFYRERLRLLADHVASALRVADYHFNNTYQYIIAREETHLQWVADAIAQVGGSLPDSQADGASEAGTTKPATATAARTETTEKQVIAIDLERQRAFVDRWRPPVDRLTNARLRRMLEVILGESLEHARFFAEALAGRTDLLGRSTTGAGRRGTVLSSRWLE